jgi:hypothetical protein
VRDPPLGTSHVNCPIGTRRTTTSTCSKEKHMNDKQRDPALIALIDQAFAHLVAIGELERVGIDEKGRTVYRSTKRARSASPSTDELN